MKTARLLVLSLLSALPLSAAAHHSFYAEFDQNKPVRLEGNVLRMEWVNPHSWLHVEVEQPDGGTEVWKVEGGSPGVLLRLGWTRDSLPPGTQVVVNGFQAKDGSTRASSSSIEFPDGRSMNMGGSSATPDRR